MVGSAIAQPTWLQSGCSFLIAIAVNACSQEFGLNRMIWGRVTTFMREALGEWEARIGFPLTSDLFWPHNRLDY